MVFLEAVGLELISAQRAIGELKAGATCFMIVAQTEKSTAEKISMILVVEEYANAFPYEIPK